MTTFRRFIARVIGSTLVLDGCGHNVRTAKEGYKVGEWVTCRQCSRKARRAV